MNESKYPGRPPEYTVERKQMTVLVPVPIVQKIKNYVKKESIPFRIKKQKKSLCK